MARLPNIYVLDRRMTMVNPVFCLRKVTPAKQMLLLLVEAHLAMLWYRMRYKVDGVIDGKLAVKFEFTRGLLLRVWVNEGDID